MNRPENMQFTDLVQWTNQDLDLEWEAPAVLIPPSEKVILPWDEVCPNLSFAYRLVNGPPFIRVRVLLN